MTPLGRQAEPGAHLVTSGDQVLTTYVVKKSSFSLTASRSRAASSSTAATAASAAASSASVV